MSHNADRFGDLSTSWLATPPSPCSPSSRFPGLLSVSSRVALSPPRYVLLSPHIRRERSGSFWVCLIPSQKSPDSEQGKPTAVSITISFLPAYRMSSTTDLTVAFPQKTTATTIPYDVLRLITFELDRTKSYRTLMFRSLPRSATSCRLTYCTLPFDWPPSTGMSSSTSLDVNSTASIRGLE